MAVRATTQVSRIRIWKRLKKEMGASARVAGQTGAGPEIMVV